MSRRGNKRSCTLARGGFDSYPFQAILTGENRANLQGMKKLILASLLLLVCASPAFAAGKHHHRHHHHHHHA